MKKEITVIKIKNSTRDILAKWKYEIHASSYDDLIERILNSGIITSKDILITEERHK